jgi:hypothetical protein
MDPRVVARIERLMPELLSQMREDLTRDPLEWEFVLLDGRANYLPGGKEFEYRRDRHPRLDSQVRILKRLRLVEETTFTNVPRYGFTEEFVDYLTAAPAVDIPAKQADAKSPSPEPPVKGGAGSRSIGSEAAVNAVLKYLKTKTLLKTEFAIQVDITGVTLRKFLKTGKVSVAKFDAIAKSMGLTREELLQGGARK